MASKGRDTAALRSLRRLGTTNGDEHKRLANIKLTLERIRAETEGVTYVECFRGSNLRRTIISIAPLSIQALSGISWINGYSTYYMELAGYSNRMSFLLTVIANLIGIVGNVVSWWLIDRVGRRDLTFYGLLSCTIVFLVTGGVACDTSDANAYRVTVAFILIWGFFFCSTIGSSAYALLGEVATARLRGKTVALGLALQNGIYLAISFILPYLFNPDKANLGAKVAFIFAAISVLCLVYLFYYQPETTGRSYEELDEMFMKHIPARQFKHYKPEAQIDGEVATAVLKGEIQAATVQEAKLVSA